MIPKLDLKFCCRNITTLFPVFFYHLYFKMFIQRLDILTEDTPGNLTFASRSANKNAALFNCLNLLKISSFQT